jgi:hypothetical protein
MQKHFPKIQFFLTLAFLAVCLFLFIFLYRGINAKNQQAENAINTWQAENSRRDQIRRLNDSIQAIEDEKTQLQTHFAQSSDVVPFLNTIEALAPEVGAKAEVASVDIATDDSGLLVSMNATGTFENIYKFLMLLENSPYEIKFTSMDMHTQAASDASVVVKTKSTQAAPAWQAVFSMKLLSFSQ